MKGIAVRTLVLLTIGIIVVGLLGYLLYRTFIAGGGILLEQCKQAMIKECQKCEALGWGVELSSPPSVCLVGGGNIHTQLEVEFPNEWGTCSDIEKECEQLLRLVTGVGEEETEIGGEGA